MSNKSIITISWDDGCCLDMKASCLLNKYGLKATFYIPKSYSRKTLSRVQIKELSKYHEIGAHSLSHCDLTSLPSIKLKNEVEGSKKYLEDIIQKKVTMFSYPFGKFNFRVKQAVRLASYYGAKTMDSIELSKQDPWELGITLASNLRRLSLKRWLWLAQRSAEHSIASKTVWHLSAHSWEIENFKMWGVLDELLSYLGEFENKSSLFNSEVLS